MRHAAKHWLNSLLYSSGHNTYKETTYFNTFSFDCCFLLVASHYFHSPVLRDHCSMVPEPLTGNWLICDPKWNRFFKKCGGALRGTEIHWPLETNVTFLNGVFWTSGCGRNPPRRNILFISWPLQQCSIKHLHLYSWIYCYYSLLVRWKRKALPNNNWLSVCCAN